MGSNVVAAGKTVNVVFVSAIDEAEEQWKPEILEI